MKKHGMILVLGGGLMAAAGWAPPGAIERDPWLRVVRENGVIKAILENGSQGVEATFYLNGDRARPRKVGAAGRATAQWGKGVPGLNTVKVVLADGVERVVTFEETMDRRSAEARPSPANADEAKPDEARSHGGRSAEARSDGGRSVGAKKPSSESPGSSSAAPLAGPPGLSGSSTTAPPAPEEARWWSRAGVTVCEERHDRLDAVGVEGVIHASLRDGPPGRAVTFHLDGERPRPRVYNLQGQAHARWAGASPARRHYVTALLDCGDLLLTEIGGT